MSFKKGHKKLFIILTVLIFTFASFVKPTQQADAAIVGKVVSIAVKKGAKELIENQAVKTMGNLALKELPSDIGSGYTKKEGFKLVAIEGTKNSPKKVAQVIDLKTLNSTQKKELSDKISDVFEEKILGARMTTWQNLVDIVIPLWSVAGMASLLNIAVNGDIKAFFEEVAFEALTQLGWITGATPVEGTLKNPIGFIPTEPNPDPETNPYPNVEYDTDIVADGFQPALPPDYAYQTTINLVPTTSDYTRIDFDFTSLEGTILNKNSVIILDVQATTENSTFDWNNGVSPTYSKIGSHLVWLNNDYGLIHGNNNQARTALDNPSFYFSGYGATVTKNNQFIKDVHFTSTPYFSYTSLINYNNYWYHTYFPIQKMKRLIIQPLILDGSSAKMIYTLITMSGDVYKVESYFNNVSGNVLHELQNLMLFLPTSSALNWELLQPKARLTVSSDIDLITVTPYEPVIEEVPLIDTDLLVIKAPQDIPITTTDGTKLKVEPAPDGENLIVTDPEGNPVEDADIVIEEDILVDPEGNPVPDPYPEPETNPDPSDPDPTKPPDLVADPLKFLEAFMSFFIAIIMYLIRLADFILTIPLVPQKPFPAPYGEVVEYYKNLQFGNVKPYPLMLSVVSLIFGFVVFRIIRRFYN